MDRREALLLVERLKRRTRDPDVLTLCELDDGLGRRRPIVLLADRNGGDWPMLEGKIVGQPIQHLQLILEWPRRFVSRR